ncbi:hypothetical protein FACS189445_2590 [Spirochaetia bacterium]|nr:hypothetical protein FACS189445_2590 [Spirochaetia bacterium]
MNEKKIDDSYPSKFGKDVIIGYIKDSLYDWCIEEIPPDNKNRTRTIIFTREEPDYE